MCHWVIPPALPPPLSRTLLTKGMQSLLPLVIYTLFLALAAPQEPLPLMRAVKPLDEAQGVFSLDDEIVSEHFTRNIQFFGRPSQERIMQSFVIVVGLGVSSHLLYQSASANPIWQLSRIPQIL